jgi:uncharacterized membrane protein YkvA (DUF1232 family)
MNSQNARRSMPAGWSWSNLMRDLVATWRLLIDPSVPGLLKLALPFMALAYLISPLDLIPLMPLDDIAVLLLAARLFVALSPRDSVNRAFNGGAAPGNTGSYSGGFRESRSNTAHQQDGEVIDTTWRIVE